MRCFIICWYQRWQYYAFKNILKWNYGYWKDVYGFSVLFITFNSLNHRWKEILRHLRITCLLLETSVIIIVCLEIFALKSKTMSYNSTYYFPNLSSWFLKLIMIVKHIFLHYFLSHIWNSAYLMHFGLFSTSTVDMAKDSENNGCRISCIVMEDDSTKISELKQNLTYEIKKKGDKNHKR